jgi:hypothetical protein
LQWQTHAQLEETMTTSWETVKVDRSSMGLYIAQPDGPGVSGDYSSGRTRIGVGAFTQEMTRRIAAAGYSESRRNFIIVRRTQGRRRYREL